MAAKPSSQKPTSVADQMSQNKKDSNQIGIAIAGDGIASRAMALALAQIGIKTTIIAPQAKPLKTKPLKDKLLQGGVQLAPNGWAALKTLELDQSCQDHALTLSMMRILSLNTGYNLIPITLNDRQSRTPYTSMTRQGLHEALQSAAKKTKKVFWKSASIDMVTSRGNQAEITLDDGQTLQADWLFGGDGSMGLCRQYVLADDRPLAHSFNQPAFRQAFRMIIKSDQIPATLQAKASNLWLGDGAHLVHYPLADGTVNLVAVMPKTATIDDLIRLVGLHPQGAFLQSTINNNPDRVFNQPFYQHPSLDVLQRGRVVLIGDAAHPMPPHLAQGAGQSLIDAAYMKTLMATANLSSGEFNQAISLQPELLQPIVMRWAADRNRHVKMVSRNAERAGAIFALDGPLAKIRNLGIASLGKRLLVKSLEDLWAS